MELTIEQALQQGVAAHKEGKLQDAERLYRAVLQSQPLHPGANYNLGLIAVSVNKAEAALPLFKCALGANPKVEQFWVSYIDALIKEQQFETAKQALSNAMKAGVVSEQLDALGASLITSADGKTPPPAQLNTLLEHYQTGRFGDAEKLAVSITQEFPTHQFGWKVLGAVFSQTGRISESLVASQHSAQLSPQDPEAHNNLGNTLKELGRLEESEASLRQAIALKPDYAEAHSNLGITLQELGRLQEAEASYTQAIALKPDFAEAHYNLGVSLQELCRLDEAEASFTQAIALKPDYAEAHRHLTSMKKIDSQDERYSKMLELYLDEKISEEQRCHINFGLAKACEDLGDFEQAFQHYRKGNVLRKKLLNYDINQDIELFEQLESSYIRIKQNSLKPDNLAKNPMPIFIVGLPRSGTTLVEQIISSHSQVTGAGELSFAAQFGASIARGFSETNDEALLNFRGKYLTKLQNISNGNLIVTDKMPQNFLYIGLLAAAFPEAIIVHVKRNPAAVCWANYKQYFASKNIGYCYELDDIVKYYGLYKNLIELWAKQLPNRIYHLDYETLTVNQEDETRKLISHIDLDWEDTCLSPQDNTRSVATASNIQVRQKVYLGSSQQWKKYKPFLNGAFDYLDDSLEQ